jgi:CubicO group peptidase (beta-lactamase class C family)
MSSTNRLCRLVVGIACTAITSHAQESRAAGPEVKAYLEKQMALRHIPGMQVAVVQHGKLLFLHSFGTAYLQDSIPVTDRTVFPIFSITKAFTGIAAVQMVEEGRLSLTDPISKYLDDLPQSWRNITLRQLLTNTSGLPNILDNNTSQLIAENEESAWRKLQTMPPLFKPGERFDYSQTNYLLVGKILDKVSGKSFMQLVREGQVEPVGMPHTLYGDDGAVIVHSARSYSWIPDDGQNVAGPGHYDMPFAVFPYPKSLMTSAGMNSTAEDLAHWVIALKEGKLFKSPDSLSLLWTAGRLIDGSTAGFSSLLNGYALGWPVGARESHRVVGPIGGSRCAIFVYPDDDFAVILLTNLTGANPESFIDEVASFYLPGMRSATGFGFPTASKALHAEVMRRGGYIHLSSVLEDAKQQSHPILLSERDWTDLGIRLFSLREYNDAIVALRANTEQHPQDGHAWEILASVYELTGQADLAAKAHIEASKWKEKTKH